MPTNAAFRLYKEPHGHTYIETPNKINVAMIPATWGAVGALKAQREEWLGLLVASPALANMCEALSLALEAVRRTMEASQLLDEDNNTRLRTLISQTDVVLFDLGLRK
jgi:hypothetical protein